MPRLSLLLLSFIGALLLSGCVHNVLYHDVSDYNRDAVSTSVFFDRHGNVYPLRAATQQSSSISLRKKEFTQLYEFELCYKSPARLQDWRQFDLIPHRSTNCRGRYLDSDASAFQEFEEVQNDRFDELSDALRDRFAASGSNTLVVLIHGYRVPEPEKTFNLMRRAITDRYNEAPNVEYLDVYWDGRKSNPVSALDAWNDAQWTAPLAGYQLRRLLNKIDHKVEQDLGVDLKLVIVTHSSGAIVAGSLLGDPRGALSGRTGCLRSENTAWLCDYSYLDMYFASNETEADRKVPQFRDPKYLLMAAATPASTFTGKWDRTAGAYDLTTGYQGPRSGQFLVTMHTKDFALIKLIGLTRLRGYSGLGAVPSELNRMIAALERNERAVVTSLPVTSFMGRKHCAGRYLSSPSVQFALDDIFGKAQRPSGPYACGEASN